MKNHLKEYYSNLFKTPLNKESLGKKEDVGKRLKECRLGCGLSQRDVARIMGVAQPVYQRFEKGIFECSYSQLVMLCIIFDETADYLLGIKKYGE